MDDSTTEWWIATIHEKNDEIDRLRSVIELAIDELDDPWAKCSHLWLLDELKHAQDT